jgi:predicted class III extradiol MEMO1 family dioxygenase
VSLSDLSRIEREDMAMLEPVRKGDADGFFRAILAQGDRRRICGLPPIYSWLRLLSPGEVRLLKYDQAYHPQFTVTFASLGMWGASAGGAPV